ncbi:MAG: ATP-binding protein [Deltaproteobacteria bacterium]|nr:ATP-binding protein [Deltaproteobacteria bacterium]
MSAGGDAREAESVCIVVAEPAPAAGRSGASGTVAALGRLGAGVRIELTHDAATCLARAREARADLVVVDHALGDEGARILAGLREHGPPALVVTPEATADAALATFRAGAADCVTAGPDFAEVLPAVAFEQIRAWRSTREHDRLRRDARALRVTLENLVEAMESGLLVLDGEGRVTHANPAAERILDEPDGALRGRSIVDWLPPGAPGLPLLAHALLAGERVRGAEAVVVRRDGRYVPVGLSLAPLESRGRRYGAVAIFQDLSELKKLQRQVLQSEKMASIGQLAAGVAHEINNPMGFVHANLFQMQEYLADVRRLIEGAAALAERAAQDGSPALQAAAAEWGGLHAKLDGELLLEDFAKAVGESIEGSERVRHIVQDLRAFAHRDDGEWVRADLNRCLDSTAHIVWTMMKHSVVLRKEYAALPPVRCLPMQLEQVFMNLLVNAYQAIEQRVRARGGAGEIVLRTEVRADKVLVSVSDDGVGIPPAHADRIFDPFFTTKEVGAGTGLGLSTSFDIVRRHGGTIRSLDRPGGGTVFEVELPLSDPAAS